MQLLLIASVALRLAVFLAVPSAAKDFPIKIVGKLAVQEYFVSTDALLPMMPRFSIDVEYTTALTVHNPLPPEELWLTLDLKQRGSQQVGLCLSMDTRCDVAFDENKNELLVRGDDFDMDGLTNYDRVLMLRKPLGFG